LAAVGFAAQTTNARRHIQPLLDSGLIAMTEPDKPNSRSQQYIVTELGQEWLAGRGADSANRGRWVNEYTQLGDDGPPTTQ
jgi:hypothetical protein